MQPTNVVAEPAASVATSAVSRRWHPARDTRIDCLIAVLCILPLLLTAHLPLTDLPNHLARQFILRDWSSSPYLQTFYDVRWALVPNLALEIFVLAARRVMSIDLAVRAFCIVTLLMLFLGTRLVNRELSGGQSRLYRVAPLLCYGGPFQYGFLSYCFGIGLALVLFGFYLRIRRQSVVALIGFLLASSFALLLCHLAAFGLFAVAVGSCALTDGLASTKAGTRRLPGDVIKRGSVALCGLLPMFLVFLWFSPTTGTVTDNAIHFSSLHEKLRSLASITLFTSPKLEAGLLALAMAGLAAALLSRTIRVHRIGLVAVAAMLVIWLLLPNIAMGAAFIDYRVPWAIAFFLLASLMPGRRYPRWSVPCSWYFTVLVLARIGLIAGLWLTWEPTLAAIDRTLASLPSGTRMMVIEGRLPDGTFFRQPDLANVASYLVARRQAFEPGMFASLSGQILYFRPAFLELWRQGGFGVAIPSRLDHLDPAYDYVLVLLPKLATLSADLPLVCQVQGPDFQLFKVAPSGVPVTGPDRRGGCPG